jgi:hypothetical protein
MLTENVGLMRELQAILTLYLGTVMGGFNMGYSAVTIPDIKQEWEIRGNTTSSFLPEIEASDEDLSWFGKNFIVKLSYPASTKEADISHAV